MVQDCLRQQYAAAGEAVGEAFHSRHIGSHHSLQIEVTTPLKG